jgi:hypothetical protein
VGDFIRLYLAGSSQHKENKKVFVNQFFQGGDEWLQEFSLQLEPQLKSARFELIVGGYNH